MPRKPASGLELSIVVPLFNEAGTIEELHRRLTAVLFLKQGGPGTIFPIVLVAGGALLLLASLLGAWTGMRVGRVLRSTR